MSRLPESSALARKPTAHGSLTGDDRNRSRSVAAQTGVRLHEHVRHDPAGNALQKFDQTGTLIDHATRGFLATFPEVLSMGEVLRLVVRTGREAHAGRFGR